MKKNIFLLLLGFLLFSCSKNKEKHYTFYYWKTNLKLDKTEDLALQKADYPFLYLRFFDVDKINGKFQPVGILTKDQSFGTKKEIVPVIFITNRTFLHIQKQEISFLAKQVAELLKKKTSEFNFQTPKEIQIDCDWTAGTGSDYFEFLKQLHDISGIEISSTLRLHQVKDKKIMGIPPVEKVYLMCYSTSSPIENSGKNSILDVAILKKYLSEVENYPLKNIRVALPIYSWGIITNHLGKHKLVNGLSYNDLENPNFKKIAENEILVEKDGFYFGHYLNKGFHVKVEEISQEQLLEVEKFLDKKIKNYPIIYYQLNSKFVKNKNF
jgi:hypothetical protein